MMKPLSEYNRMQGLVLPAGRTAILLAVYNGEDFLEEQLESLVNQTYQDFTCIIHDDGSTDGSQEIIQQFRDLHPDHFMILEGSPTGGAKYNFMYMMRRVEADYIMFCDQDDVWLPEKVEKTMAAMKQAEVPAVPVAVYSNVMIADSQLRVINPSMYDFSGVNRRRNGLEDLLQQNMAVGSTMMINRPLRDAALLLNVDDQIFMHDWFLALLAGSLGKLVFVNESLMYYRQHGSNVSGALAGKSRRERFFDLLKTGPNRFLKSERRHMEISLANAKAVRCVLDAMGLDEKNEKYRIVKKCETAYSGSLLRGLIYFYKWKRS